MSQLHRTQQIAVVTQVINELEAQGLLMLFDRQNHVAERLTGDLIAAGVVQSPSEPVSSAPAQSLNEPSDS